MIELTVTVTESSASESMANWRKLLTFCLVFGHGESRR
jgi:hypothetical protein